LGDADLVAGVDRHLNQSRGLRSRMAGQAINAVVTAAKPYHRSLLEHRPARFAEARLLSPQTRRDGAYVGDFTGAEAIDVGRAGPALLRRGRGQSGASREKAEEKAERRSIMGPARHAQKSLENCLHDSIP